MLHDLRAPLCCSLRDMRLLLHRRLSFLLSIPSSCFQNRSHCQSTLTWAFRSVTGIWGEQITILSIYPWELMPWVHRIRFMGFRRGRIPNSHFWKYPVGKIFRVKTLEPFWYCVTFPGRIFKQLSNQAGTSVLSSWRWCFSGHCFPP